MHGAKYLWWRNGRPRWQPSQTLRQKGFKGQDLKDADGNWLHLEEAKDAANELNRAAGVTLGPRKAKRAPRAQRERIDDGGFVYFLRADDFVKIGYSLHPARRVIEVQTGLPYSMSSLHVYRGSLDDERRIHELFLADRFRGEWFHMTTAIKKFLVACAQFERLALDQRATR